MAVFQHLVQFISNYWILFTFLALLLHWLLREKRRCPPGPFSVPLLGTLSIPGEKVRPAHLYFHDLALKYGPVFNVKVGSTTITVLNDIDLIRETFVKKSHNFSGRPYQMRYHLLNPELLGVVGAKADTSSQRRKLGLTTLRKFGVGKHSLEERIHEEIGFLLEAIADTKGQPFDPQTAITNAVSNVICSIVFGDRFPYDDIEFNAILDLISMVFKDYQTNSHIDYLPLVRFLPKYQKFLSDMLDHDRKVKEFIMKKIQEHKASRDAKHPRDLIDVYLDEIEKNTNDSDFNQNNLIRFVFDFFVAGTETTASTIRWMILHMANNQSIQTKIRDEISREIADSQLPTMANRAGLPYLEACVNEISRLYTVVPLGLPHTPERDDMIGEYHVNAGDTILLNLWAIHRDPNIWQEPELFRPERFLDDNGCLKNREEFIPFSVGRRVCLGEQLAKTELFLFASALFQRFHFSPPRDMPQLPDEGDLNITYAPKPHRLCAVPRFD